MNNMIQLTDEFHNTYSIPFEVSYSERKSYSISLTEEGFLKVKLPLFLRNSDITSILKEKSHWILTHYKTYEKRKLERPPSNLTQAQQEALEKRYREAAREYITKRAGHWADLMGVTYSSIAIRSQKTRWGSCSSRGTLSFNWKLMLAPPPVLDYVIIHELCHLVHMNHSADFWKCVSIYMPDYKIKRQWLKNHGHELTLA